MPTRAILFLLIAASYSDQRELEPHLDSGATTFETVSSDSSVLLYNETFENSLVFKGLHEQFGTDHAFSLASSPVKEGYKSGRFELRDSDPIQSGGTRAEVLFPEQTNLNRWYSFSVFFPTADYAKDSYTEIISQWHQGGGASPSIALEIIEDRYRLVIPSGASGTGSTEKIDIGPITKDIWNSFAFRIKHSSEADGLMEVWLNGDLILSRTGANMYSLSTYSPPRWKLGIYKWKWNYGKTTDTEKRVLYYDNIRIGNENATLADVTSTSEGSVITEGTSGM